MRFTSRRMIIGLGSNRLSLCQGFFFDSNGISSEVFFRALRSLNVMHSRVDPLPSAERRLKCNRRWGLRLVVWTGHMIRLSTCAHTGCGILHAPLGPSTPELALAKVLSKGFLSWPQFRDNKVGKRFFDCYKVHASKDLSGCSY